MAPQAPLSPTLLLSGCSGPAPGSSCSTLNTPPPSPHWGLQPALGQARKQAAKHTLSHRTSFKLKHKVIKNFRLAATAPQASCGGPPTVTPISFHEGGLAGNNY